MVVSVRGVDLACCWGRAVAREREREREFYRGQEWRPVFFFIKPTKDSQCRIPVPSGEMDWTGQDRILEPFLS